MSKAVDFQFIKDVGIKVYEILINDPDQEEWFYGITEKPDPFSGVSTELMESIIEYLKLYEDEETQHLVGDIKLIIKDEDNIENLLNYIFFPPAGEEEEEFEDDEDEIIVWPSNPSEEDEDLDDKSLSPQIYFDKIVSKVSKTLCISEDVTYLLLQQCGWDQSQSISKWLSKQKDILESLRIKIGSDQVPNVTSPLRINQVENGECPICFVEGPLFENYCGHKLCEECWREDIKSQVEQRSVPICRYCDSETNKICGAEIMPCDVKKQLDKYPELICNYEKILLQSEVVSCKDAAMCSNQYCNWTITNEDQGNRKDLENRQGNRKDRPVGHE